MSGLFFHPLFGVNLSRTVPDSVLLWTDVCLMTEVPFMPARDLQLVPTVPGAGSRGSSAEEKQQRGQGCSVLPTHVQLGGSLQRDRSPSKEPCCFLPESDGQSSSFTHMDLPIFFHP